MATYEDMYHSMHGKFCHTRLRMRELTWPLIDGSITAPNIKFAVGSTRSYITSAAAFTYQNTHSQELEAREDRKREKGDRAKGKESGKHLE